MSKLGMSLCWSLLAEGTLEPALDLGIDATMLRGVASDAFEFVRGHYGDYGVMPQRETVINDVDIDPDFDFDVDEPAAYYAKKVAERHTFNAQRKAARELSDAMRDRDPTAVHEAAQGVVQAGMDSLVLGNGEIVNQRLTGPERLERYIKLGEAPGGIVGIRSPWDALDQATGGYGPGQLITFVARLGLGKTWAALLNAIAAEGQGKRVGVVSPEMNSKALEMRSDAIRFRVPYRDLRRGELDAVTMDQFAEALRNHEESGVDHFISNNRVRDVLGCEIFARERELDMLVVDGMYLLNPTAKPEDDPRAAFRMAPHERVAEIAKGIANLAARLEIPVIATGQFNRNVRAGAMRAGSESVGHSDAIGQFSHAMIGLFQDDAMRLAGQMQLAFLKNREGPLIEFICNWDFVRMDFSPLGSAEETNGMRDDDDDQAVLF